MSEENTGPKTRSSSRKEQDNADGNTNGEEKTLADIGNDGVAPDSAAAVNVSVLTGINA